MKAVYCHPVAVIYSGRLFFFIFSLNKTLAMDCCWIKPIAFHSHSNKLCTTGWPSDSTVCAALQSCVHKTIIRFVRLRPMPAHSAPPSSPLLLWGVKLVPDAFSHGYPPQLNRNTREIKERRSVKLNRGGKRKNVWNFWRWISAVIADHPPSRSFLNIPFWIFTELWETMCSPNEDLRAMFFHVPNRKKKQKNSTE